MVQHRSLLFLYAQQLHVPAIQRVGDPGFTMARNFASRNLNFLNKFNHVRTFHTFSSSMRLRFACNQGLTCLNTIAANSNQRVVMHSACFSRCRCRPVSTDASSDGKVVKKLKVLYDGDCPLCMQEIKFVQYLNKKKDALELVNIASPDYSPENNNNISYETAMGVMHVVGPDQQVYTKVQAMYEMYSALGLRWMVAYMRWPLLSTLFDWAYMVFARNRLQWSSRWRRCHNGKCKIENKSTTEDST